MKKFNNYGQPDIDELGASSWSLLHTLAAKYSHKPTDEEQRKMLNFLDGMSRFYPCEKCAYHMRKYVTENKPNVTSRYGLQRWLCDFHNSVNKRLQKDIFDCSLVNDRWSTGQSCSSDRCSI